MVAQDCSCSDVNALSDERCFMNANSLVSRVAKFRLDVSDLYSFVPTSVSASAFTENVQGVALCHTLASTTRNGSPKFSSSCGHCSLEPLLPCPYRAPAR